jgi:hypothetical protein
VSGRNYRLQIMTIDELYNRYCTKVHKLRGNYIPLTITTIRNILCKWNIRHSKDSSICPLCKLIETNGILLEGLEEKDLNQWINKYNKHKDHHHYISQRQHQAHKQDKKELVQNKRTDRAMSYMTSLSFNHRVGSTKTSLSLFSHIIQQTRQHTQTILSLCGRQTTK